MKLRTGAAVNIALPQGVTWYDLLNLGGVDFFNAHSWTWLEAERATIEARAGDDFVRLPRDYRARVAAAVKNAGSQFIRIVDSERINQLRSAENLIGGSVAEWYLCFAGELAQDSPADAPYFKAPMWPPCTQTGEPTIRLIYDRQWSPVSAADDSMVLKIPGYCEPAFLQRVGCVAWEKIRLTPCPDREIHHRVTMPECIARDEERTPAVKPKAQRFTEEYPLPSEWIPNP